jgi:hypothetical protein
MTAESKARLAQAQAEYEAFEAGESAADALETTETVDEPVRRGRGRLPRVILDPDADVAP